MEKIRIQKMIADSGYCSRRKAEELISRGRVKLNGHPVKLGDKCGYKDLITVDGERLFIPRKRNFVYIMLNKPRGYVTTVSDELDRRCVMDLLEDVEERVYPVGRLDRNSEGLLLFTNDGEFANKLMHPSHEINKTYRVEVSNYSEKGIERLKQPIILDGYRIRTPEVQIVRKPNTESDTAVLNVTIHEGRNRQVRRMCATAGMKVLRLIRIQEGQLRLGKLPCGSWRYLTADEVAMLQK